MATTTTGRAAQLLNPYDNADPSHRGRGRSALSAGAAGLAAAGVLIGGGATAAWADEDPTPRAASESTPGQGGEQPPGPEVYDGGGSAPVVTEIDMREPLDRQVRRGGDPAPAVPSVPAQVSIDAQQPPEWSASSDPAPAIPAARPSEPSDADIARMKAEDKIAELEKDKAARRYRINHNDDLTQEQKDHRLQNMRKQFRKDIEKVNASAPEPLD